MKSVVILSGGMDSAVALAQTRTKHEPGEVVCLNFDYGSKHNERERESARQIAKYYGVELTEVSLPFVNQLFKSDLLKSGGDIPEGHYEHPSMIRTVVPFRNGIMLAIGAGYAESLGAKELVIGNHIGDHAIYPDCRQSFIHPMRAAICEGTYLEVNLLSPFVGNTKREIALNGKGLAVPFNLTYSCYNGREKHCGKCGTCSERKEALEGFDDTEYEA